MSCDKCQYYFERLQGVHETYLAGLCTFNGREKWIASEVDGLTIIETPKWCPLKSKSNESKFMKNSIPFTGDLREDPYQ